MTAVQKAAGYCWRRCCVYLHTSSLQLSVHVSFWMLLDLLLLPGECIAWLIFSVVMWRWSPERSETHPGAAPPLRQEVFRKLQALTYPPTSLTISVRHRWSFLSIKQQRDLSSSGESGHICGGGSGSGRCEEMNPPFAWGTARTRPWWMIDFVRNLPPLRLPICSFHQSFLVKAFLPPPSLSPP